MELAHAKYKKPTRTYKKADTYGKKICTKCGIPKSPKEYYFNSSYKTYDHTCKECVKQRGKEYRLAKKAQKITRVVSIKPGFAAGLRTCTKCNILKSVSEYYFDSRNNSPRSVCKECSKTERRKADIRQYNHEWYEDNKARIKANRQARKLAAQALVITPPLPLMTRVKQSILAVTDILHQSIQKWATTNETKAN